MYPINIRCDDETVTTVSEEDVLNAEGCVISSYLHLHKIISLLIACQNGISVIDLTIFPLYPVILFPID